LNAPPTDTDSTYREVDLETARWLKALGHHVEWQRFGPNWSIMFDHKNFKGRDKKLGYSYRVREK
jgi:hypothetical protein